MNNITFDFKKEPVQKKSKGSYLLLGFLGLFLLGVFVLSCGSDSNPVTSDSEPEVVIETAAHQQLFNITNPDPVTLLTFVNDTDSSQFVKKFETALSFRYIGENNLDVSVVRGVILFGLDSGGFVIEIGRSIGIIVDFAGSVSVLKSNNFYRYFSTWNNDPFLIADATYTNFYVDLNSDASASKMIISKQSTLRELGKKLQ